jgi:hypothetical protein
VISDAIAQGIGTAGPLKVAGLTYSAAAGGNVFTEALPQDPDVAVVVKSFGGGPPSSLLPYNEGTLQILIRGNEDPDTAIALWDALFTVLQGAPKQTLPDGTILISCLVTQGAPVNIGPDANGRHRLSMNIAVEVVNFTANRTEQ